MDASYLHSPGDPFHSKGSALSSIFLSPFSFLRARLPSVGLWRKMKVFGSRRRRQVGHATSISPSPPWLTRIKSTPAPASSSSAAAPERNGKRG